MQKKTVSLKYNHMSYHTTCTTLAFKLVLAPFEGIDNASVVGMKKACDNNRVTLQAYAISAYYDIQQNKLYSKRPRINCNAKLRS